MKYLKLLAALGITFLTGGIGTLATIPNILTWYEALSKPPLLPPSEVFGPTWTVLYAMMAIALYLVWAAKSNASKKRAFLAYGVQLALNALWSIVFFGLHTPWLGVVVIALLVAAIVWTMVEFYRHTKWTLYLLLPYIAWVSFAVYLTIGVALLN